MLKTLLAFLQNKELPSVRAAILFTAAAFPTGMACMVTEVILATENSQNNQIPLWFRLEKAEAACFMMWIATAMAWHKALPPLARDAWFRTSFKTFAFLAIASVLLTPFGSYLNALVLARTIGADIEYNAFAAIVTAPFVAIKNFSLILPLGVWQGLLTKRRGLRR